MARRVCASGGENGGRQNDEKTSRGDFGFHEFSGFFAAFKMFFDFFQGFSLGFRQKESRRDEIDHRAAGKGEEHRRVAILANGRQEDGGDGGGDGLIDEERDAHAVGPDARGHQFREREPDADTGADRKKSHEREQADGGEPTVMRRGNGRDERVLNFERRVGCGVEIGEWIREERDVTLFGGRTAGAGDFNWFRGEVVRAGHRGCCAKIAIGINDHERRGFSAVKARFPPRKP